MANKIRRWENLEDGHSKFWELEYLKDGSVSATYGKIDKTVQGPKIYALEEVEKLIPQKEKKGYEEV